MVGIALLISNIITLFVANKMPRRLMLIFSSFGISAALIGMGVYLHLKALEKLACLEYDHSNNFNNTTTIVNLDDEASPVSGDTCEAIYTHSIGWLPLLLLMVYIFFFNLGYGAMIWITVVEILPLHVRSVATSLSVAFTSLCSFLISHTYIDLKDTIDSEGVFWLYGSISFVGLIFIVVCVPETKGKNEAELREYFQKKKELPSSSHQHGSKKQTKTRD